MRSRTIAVTLFLAAATTLAADPATQPDAPAGNARPAPHRPMFPRLEGLRNMHGGMGGGMGGPNGHPPADMLREDAPTADEWKEITAFSQENFPNRWKMFERVRDARGEDSPLIAAIKLHLANRYRTLKHAEKDMPNVYDAALQQGKLEDNAWGIAQQLQQDPGNTDLRGQLHDAVATLVKSALDERARRLKIAHDALDAEQEAFNRDSAGIDDLIERRTTRMTAAGADFDRTLPAPGPAAAPSTAPAAVPVDGAAPTNNK